MHDYSARGASKESNMAPDDPRDDRTAATYGHPVPVIQATGPAVAATFAARVFGKYFVAPVIRRGPSLVLRMLQPAGIAGDASTGKKGPTALDGVTEAPARPAVRLATSLDRQLVRPSHGASATWTPGWSWPQPVFMGRLLVQRNPLIVATAPLAPAAMTVVAPCALGVPLTMTRQATATAIALPGADRAKIPADTATTLAEHGMVVRRPTTSAGLSPVADPRHVTATAFRSTTAERILASSTATAHEVPPSMHDPAAGRAPTLAVPVVARSGAPSYAASRPASGLLRQVSMAGDQRLVQRKLLALPRLGTPVTAAIGGSFGGPSFGVRSSAAAPEHNYPAASAITATPSSDGTRQLTSTLPLTISAAGRSALPAAMTVVAPCALGVPLTMTRQATATAIALPGADRAKIPADTATTLAEHGMVVRRPTTSAGLSPVADPRHVTATAFRSTTAERILASSTATAHEVPPSMHDHAAGRAPTLAVPVVARSGAPSYAASRPASGLLRQVSMAGDQRLVQRKLLALPRLGTPVTAAIGGSFGGPSFGVRSSAAAPEHNYPAASAITATPSSDGTRQLTSTLPLTISAAGRSALPDARTTPERWQPARALIMPRQILDRPLVAGLERRHDLGDVLQAPDMTDLVVDVPTAAQPAAGTRPMATELTLRTSFAEENPLPTLVAATLGAATPTPTALATHQDLSSSQGGKVSSMSIEFLADRVFSILERRLVVERERRGIRS
jgi:hypothetical protein